MTNRTVPSATSPELLETTHVVPMPAVAGWTEDQRLDYMEAHRKIMARRGGRIVKERRVRNTAFDNRGEKTSWEFVVEWSDDRT